MAKMIENKQDRRASDVAKKPEVKEQSEADAHPGEVKRTLNFRDRLLIMQCLRASIAQGGDLKALSKIRKCEELLDDEGATNYFEAMDDDFNRRAALWANAKRDFINNPKDPKCPDPGAQPKRSDKEDRGKDGTFWIPSKMDVYIQDTIRGAKFPPNQTEFALELAEKFGIKVDD